MLSNIILRSTAAFGGAPFRLKKCTALTSAVGGAGGGAAVRQYPECGAYLTEAVQTLSYIAAACSNRRLLSVYHR